MCNNNLIVNKLIIIILKLKGLSQLDLTGSIAVVEDLRQWLKLAIITVNFYMCVKLLTQTRISLLGIRRMLGVYMCTLPTSSHPNLHY